MMITFAFHIGRIVLISALVMLVTFAATSTLASNTRQVWLLTAGIITVSSYIIVKSTIESVSPWGTERSRDYVPFFEMILRPSMLMAPVIYMALLTRFGMMTWAGLRPEHAGMLAGFGMLLIVFSTARRRYSSSDQMSW